MEKIKAHKFLEYAKLNLKELRNDNKERVLINTYGCISKALHSQVDELVKYIKVLKEPKKKLDTFRDKFEFVSESGLFAPEQILYLNYLRYKLEHEYLVPLEGEVKLGIANLSYFIKEAQQFMKIPVESIRRSIDETLTKLEKIRKETSDSKKTLEMYMLQAKKFFLFFGKNPYNLDIEDANTYLKKLIAEKYPPRHIQHVQAILNFIYTKVLNKEIKWLVKRPSIKREEYPILTKDDFDKIFKLTTLRNQLIIRLIYDTGINVSKLVKLKIEDVAKLSLSQDYLQDLKKYIGSRKDGYLFLTKMDTPVAERGIEWILQNLSKKIGRRITTIIIKKSNPKIRYKYSTINQARKRLPRARLKKEEVITKKELSLLIKNTEDDLKADYIYFIYHFGMGLNQFMNVKYEDIDDKHLIIKTKPARHFNFNHVKITEDVIERLKKYCIKYNIKGGRLFSSYSDGSIRRMIAIAGLRGGVDKKKLGYGVLSNSQKFAHWYGIEK